MKKIIGIIVSVLCLLLMVTPVSAEEKPTNLLEEIKQRGYIVVGVSPDYMPYEFIDITATGEDKYVGSDIELAKYIANELGVELKLEISDFDGVLTNIATKRVDIGLSGLSYTEERAQSIMMTQTYYESYDEAGCQGLLVMKDQLDNFNTLEDFEGLTIAAQQGSLQEGFVLEQIPNATVSPIKEVPNGVTLMSAGSDNISAVAVSCSNGKGFEQSNSQVALAPVLFDNSNADNGTRVGVPLGEQELFDVIDKIAGDVKESGLYGEWYSSAEEFGLSQETITSKNMFSVVKEITVKYGTMFLSGLLVTLELAAVTVLFGTLLGTLIALLKIWDKKVTNFICTAYVEIIRGTPLLLQLWLFVIALTPIFPNTTVSVVIALIINSSAYVSEIIRGGIVSVDKGQTEAALSLGMSKFNTMRKIIIPQAIKIILPSLGNEFIMMVKETSLASIFYVGDLMTVTNIVKGATFKTIEPLIIAGIIYFVVTFTLSRIVLVFERRMSVSDK